MSDRPLFDEWNNKSNREKYINKYGRLKCIRISIEPMPDFKHLAIVQMLTYDSTLQTTSYYPIASNSFCTSYQNALDYCTDKVMPVLLDKLSTGEFDGLDVHAIHAWFRANDYCVYNKIKDNSAD